jgi:hypothetical protein
MPKKKPAAAKKRAPKRKAAAPAAPATPPPARAPRRGRPSKYASALGARICERLASGETLRAICRADGMPSEAAVRAWALDVSHPFSAQYVRAREIGFFAMADEIVEIADDATNDYVLKQQGEGQVLLFDREHVKRSELRINSRKWLMARGAPKAFGDKIEVGGNPDQPITVNHAADQLISKLAEIAARSSK